MDGDLATCTLAIEPQADDLLTTPDEFAPLPDTASWGAVVACLIAGDE